VDLCAVSARAVLLDQRGGRLHNEQLVGDVPDPGVVLALLYEHPVTDAAGRAILLPPPDECHRTMTAMAQADTEIAGKLARHLESPEATLMARLHLVD
jgi:hypothetical protein